MSAFLYFVEGHRTPVTPELLTAWGLDYAFDAVPHHQESPGPSGDRGTLLCDAEAIRPFVAKYLPDEQEWRQIPESEGGGEKAKVWIGYFRDARPTRDDLARAEMLPGYPVELADELEWQVPIARQVSAEGASECVLPAYLDLDDEGQVKRGKVVEKFRWLWERCEPFWSAWYKAWTAAHQRMDQLPDDATNAQIGEAGRFSIDCPTMLADAVAVLGANYRIGLIEAICMELFRTDSGAGEILKAACDTDQATIYLQKKTEERTPAD